MLRNVLGDYLDKVRERELDLPLLLLLPAMGFYDVHLTHGAVEFGKDIIAKRREEGDEIQYSFQSKVGDISQADWRNDIQGQILESVLTTLSHPNFDTGLPHQVVLITTGELKGNARLALQNLNRRIEETYRERPIIFWDRENLTEYFLEYGLSGLLRTTAPGFMEYGRFLLLYGRALQGLVSNREIESYSRQWLDPSIEVDRRLLQNAIEAEVVSRQCVELGYLYEAVHVHLALVRVLCAAAYTDHASRISHLYAPAVARLHTLCVAHLQLMREMWYRERNLLRIAPLDMTTYLVHCARILEMISLAYFSTTDQIRRDEAVTFLGDFITTEPGCCHPLSDHYAVSLVLAALVLCDAGRRDVVRELLRRATVWLCDRYEDGAGLAGLEADEVDETRTLLGYAFDFIDIPQHRGDFLGTALCDLAAFLGDDDLYAAIVNDIKACNIHPEYWQPQDTVGSCSVEGEDVLHYPSVSYDDNLTPFGNFEFASHLVHESETFQFAAYFGPEAAVMLMTLLRDRYFPKLWPLLVSSRPRVPQMAL
ncbi:MAG: restriction endonuclease [Chloroflexota bacterium]|nr:restriction endonuclease [Chloroflexota bacterium]